MSKSDLQKNLEKYERQAKEQEDAASQKPENIKRFLPILVVLNCSGNTVSAENIRGYFSGSKAVESVETKLAEKIDFVDDLVFCSSKLGLRLEKVMSTIVIFNVSDLKNGGACLALKKLMDYAYLITDVKKIDLIKRLSNFFSESDDLSFSADGLIAKYDECYDILRHEFAEVGFDGGCAEDYIRSARELKGSNNALTTNVSKIHEQLKLISYLK